MTFPTTPVLESFTNGASQAVSARAGWSTNHLGGYGDFVTDSTPTKAVAATNADNVWGTNYLNCEVYATIVDWPSLSGQFRVCGRVSGGNYYMFFLFSTGWHVQRWDAGVATVDIANGSLSPAAGDSIGLSCIGSTINGYYKSGAGAWTLLGGGTDTLYTTANAIAVLTEGGTNNSITNFGGGEAPDPVGRMFSRHIGPATVGFRR